MDDSLMTVGLCNDVLTSERLLYARPLRNVTRAMDKLMYPPIAKGKVRDRTRMIVAAKEGGKTSLANSLALKTLSMYPEGSVNIIATKSIKLGMERINSKLVQHIIVDDAIKEQNSTDINGSRIGADFMEIRHIYEDKNNTDTGVVITDFLTQRWIGIHPMFRASTHCFIFKSILTNPKDNDDIRSFIGARYYNELRDITRRIYEDIDDSAKSDCIAHMPFSDRTGYYRFDYVRPWLKFLDPNAQDDLVSDLVYGSTHDMFLFDKKDAVKKMMKRGDWREQAKAYYMLHYESDLYPTQRAVAKKLKMDPGNLSKSLNRFRGELSRISGDEFERYWALRMEKDGYQVRRYGGTGEPDIIATDPSGGKPQIVSCKCLDYTRPIKQLITEYRPEIERARELGATSVEVVVYNLHNRKLHQMTLALDQLPVTVTIPI